MQSLHAFVDPPTAKNTSGLIHAECMAAMELGAPILTPKRMQLRNLAMFAAWENEEALDQFLTTHEIGQSLFSGWHVRMKFIRRWGHFPNFEHLPEEAETSSPSEPVVAVTLARLKLPQVYRFIHFGRPVEEQVRDHPETTLALATMRPLKTFSTFSIWRSQQAMTDMVRGHSSGHNSKRHAEAMKERNRKDFHHHFITLRFTPLSEHGEWEGNGGHVPRLRTKN